MNINKSELINLFPTPLWTSIISNFQEVNKKMYQYIKSLQSQNKSGMTKSNLVGWHSDYFNLNEEEPRFFINAISSYLNNVFNEMGWDVKNQEVKITNMWSIVNIKEASKYHQKEVLCATS